jgi:CO dehydrogenase maturation factor
VEAGIEHFGRGIEKYVDAVLVIVDPTFESIEIANRVNTLCRSMGIENCCAILNGMRDSDMEIMMRDSLITKGVGILGSVMYDKEIFKAGLQGSIIDFCPATTEIGTLVDILESLFAEKWYSEKKV